MIEFDVKDIFSFLKSVFNWNYCVWDILHTSSCPLSEIQHLTLDILIVMDECP